MLADARSAQLEDRKMTRDTPNKHHQKLVKKRVFLALFGARLDIHLKIMQTAREWDTFYKKRIFARQSENSQLKCKTYPNLCVFAPFFHGRVETHRRFKPS